MIMNNRRIAIKEVTDEVDIPIGLYPDIFSNVLGMKHLSVKFVPKLWSFVTQTVAWESLIEVNSDSDLHYDSIVTMEGSWLAKTEKGSTSAVERQGYVYWFSGLVKPQGQAINKVQLCLRKEIRQKCWELRKPIHGFCITTMRLFIDFIG